MSTLDFTTVKNIVIPDGPVKKIEIGGQTVWKAYDAEIEYLQSTGTNYIDTGIVAQENDTILTDVMFLSKSGDNFMLGASGISGDGGSIWMEIYANRTWYVRYGSSASVNVAGSTGVRNSYELRKKYVGVDGTKKLTPNFAGMPSRNLFLMGRNSATPAGGIGRLYRASIVRNGTPIIDFIPVRIGTTGYLYDKIQGKLYGNAGTGNFTLGPDVNVL